MSCAAPAVGTAGRNPLDDRDAWMKQKWLLSKRGNPYVAGPNHHCVLFSPITDWWKFRVTYQGATGRSRKFYNSLDEAKSVAFDAINWMRIVQKLCPPEEADVC